MTEYGCSGYMVPGKQLNDKPPTNVHRRARHRETDDLLILWPRRSGHRSRASGGWKRRLEVPL